MDLSRAIVEAASTKEQEGEWGEESHAIELRDAPPEVQETLRAIGASQLQLDIRNIPDLGVRVNVAFSLGPSELLVLSRTRRVIVSPRLSGGEPALSLLFRD